MAPWLLVLERTLIEIDYLIRCMRANQTCKGNMTASGATKGMQSPRRTEWSVHFLSRAPLWCLNSRATSRVVTLVTAFVLCLESAHGQPLTLTSAVVVGGVTESSARFWIRLSGQSAVRIELSTDSSFSAALSTNTDSTRPARNYATIVNVAGLQADTKYFYRPWVSEAPLAVAGSFMTFPPKGTAVSFTFGFGSCQQSGNSLPSSNAPGNVFREVIKFQPRFFLQIGDWGYPDTTDNLPFDSTFFAADFARVQATYLTKYSPDYPMDSLLRMSPVDYVYDDHDFMNNNSSALCSDFTVANKPNQFSADYVAREIVNPPGARENSIRGYIENMPSYPLPDSTRGIYHTFSYGNADFFVLDLRSERSPNLEPFVKNAGTNKWEFDPAPSHSIVGRDAAPGSGESQLTWLLNGLRASKATWKFLVSTVPFNQGYSRAMTLALLLQDFTVNVPEYPPGTALIGAAFELADKWIGFPADADTLLSVLSLNSIKNVIVLSGDSHTAALDDGANAGLPEILAGGLDITNSKVVKFLADFGINVWDKGGQGLSTQTFNNAFGKVTVFGQDSVRLSLVDEFGLEFATYTVPNSLTGIRPRAEAAGEMAFSLRQNYPNPFNPVTIIQYEVPHASDVVLEVYNLLGQSVARLVHENQRAGLHQATFDGSRLASGAYIYRLTAGSFMSSKVMLLLK